MRPLLPREMKHKGVHLNTLFAVPIASPAWGMSACHCKAAGGTDLIKVPALPVPQPTGAHAMVLWNRRHSVSVVLKIIPWMTDRKEEHWAAFVCQPAPATRQGARVRSPHLVCVVHTAYPCVTLQEALWSGSTFTPASLAHGHPKYIMHLFPCALMNCFQMPKLS